MLIFGIFGNTVLWAKPKARKQTGDSLLYLLQQTQSDSVKINLYIQMAKSCQNVDKEKGIEYYRNALKYNMNNEKKALVLNNIGFYYWKLGKFNEAIASYDQSLELYSQINDSLRLGMLYNNIGVCYWAMGKLNQALQSYKNSLKFRKAVNDLDGVSTVTNNIGLIYQDFGVYKEAIKYHNEALDIARKIQDYKALAYSYANIAKCYEMIKDYKQALKYHLLGCKVYDEKVNQDDERSFYLANIGAVYNELGQTDSAVYYFNQSLKHAKQINNTHRAAIAEYNLGKIWFQQGYSSKALKLVNSSYQSSLDGNYLNLVKDNRFLLSEIEHAHGNEKAALSYFKSATQLKDSLFNKKEVSKFMETTISLIEQKEADEKDLLKQNIEIQKASIRKEKMMRWLLLASGALLWMVIFFIARSRKSIKKLYAKLQSSEYKLKQSNASKDKFFSIIAHDLRSPLLGIVGLSEILLKQKAENENKKYHRIIYESSTQTLNLLDNLLSWSRAQKGQIAFRPQTLAIGLLIQDIIALYNEQARKKGINLISQVPSDVEISADMNMINTVIRNLISNAIKFTYNGGEIVVGSDTIFNAKSQKFIKIFVKDNGVGIPSSLQHKLFNIAENITTPGTENESGSGLGLILCHEFVHKHGGEIWVESTINKGTTFYFTIPLSSKK